MAFDIITIVSKSEFKQYTMQSWFFIDSRQYYMLDKKQLDLTIITF